MTLLIIWCAAIISTVVKLKWDKQNQQHVSTLALIYWGASLMWVIDAMYQYIELRDKYWSDLVKNSISDLYLGILMIAIGVIMWQGMIQIKGFKERIRKHYS